MGFTRKQTLERWRKNGKSYRRPRTSNTRPGERHALTVPEASAYSIRTVEQATSLIKLQRLVEDFRKYKGTDRKTDVEDALIAKVVRTVWGYQPREIQTEVLR
jgi:hypothetical protein